MSTNKKALIPHGICYCQFVMGVRNSSIITSLRTPIRKWGVHIHSIYHLFFSHIFSGIGYLCKLKRYLTYFYFLASHCTSVQKYYQIFPWSQGDQEKKVENSTRRKQKMPINELSLNNLSKLACRKSTTAFF